jgi:DinB superfamily
MEAEQVQWASQLREIPIRFRQALRTEDDRAIRHRPAMGEWSAIEVLGHMIDKMALWSSRIERIWQEERPSLPGYDQDAAVRDQGYQQADPAVLCEHLEHQRARPKSFMSARLHTNPAVHPSLTTSRLTSLY